MATIKKYNGSTWENAVVRKYGTASEIITPPTTIYADGTAISTYTIKGNTVQNGTPTPSNPVAVNGVGNKTANLFDTSLLANNYNLDYNTGLPYSFDGRIATLNPITYSGITSAILTYRPTTSGTNIAFIYSVYNDNSFVRRVANNSSGTVLDLSDGNKLYVCFFNSTISITTDSINDIMLNTGSQPLPYEPYGQYKIPISSNGAALTPMYFSQQLFKIGDITDNYVSSGTVTYNSSKYELTGGEDWQKSASINGWFYVLNLLRIRPDSEALCTDYVYYPPSYSQSATLPNGGFAYDEFKYGAYTAIAIVNTDYNNVNDFKQYLATRYAAGNPVTIYYIKQTPTTETVTASSIPTTEGANTITVDTTVQPSEFTATWTGWHDASVKEKSENIYDKYHTIELSVGTRYGQYVDKGTYSIYNDTDNKVYWFGNDGYTRFTACEAHSTATVSLTEDYTNVGFFMPYDDASLGDVSIVQGSTVPDHYIPYWK